MQKLGTIVLGVVVTDFIRYVVYPGLGVWIVWILPLVYDFLSLQFPIWILLAALLAVAFWNLLYERRLEARESERDKGIEPVHEGGIVSDFIGLIDPTPKTHLFEFEEVHWAYQIDPYAVRDPVALRPEDILIAGPRCPECGADLDTTAVPFTEGDGLVPSFRCPECFEIYEGHDRPSDDKGVKARIAGIVRRTGAYPPPPD